MFSTLLLVEDMRNVFIRIILKTVEFAKRL